MTAAGCDRLQGDPRLTIGLVVTTVTRGEERSTVHTQTDRYMGR